MGRNIIAIRQMGETLCWTLIHQAMGMPDVKLVSDFMENKVALLLFARESLPERLCSTAAVRQMGGTTIYEGSQSAAEWRSSESRFQKDLLPIFGYYFDCLYIYGIDLVADEIVNSNLRFPIINAGGGWSHPVHALADIACMLKLSHEKKRIISTAWIGAANGSLYSLVEACAWFPFSLKIAMPDEKGKDLLQKRIAELNVPVQFVNSPEEAVAGCEFIYAGKREMDEKKSGWIITSKLFEHSAPDSRLLLSASPIRAIAVEESVFAAGKTLLTLQAQYRLAIHKRVLHWVFE